MSRSCKLLEELSKAHRHVAVAFRNNLLAAQRAGEAAQRAADSLVAELVVDAQARGRRPSLGLLHHRGQGFRGELPVGGGSAGSCKLSNAARAVAAFLNGGGREKAGGGQSPCPVARSYNTITPTPAPAEFQLSRPVTTRFSCASPKKPRLGPPAPIQRGSDAATPGGRRYGRGLLRRKPCGAAAGPRVGAAGGRRPALCARREAWRGPQRVAGTLMSRRGARAWSKGEVGTPNGCCALPPHHAGPHQQRAAGMFWCNRCHVVLDRDQELPTQKSIATACGHLFCTWKGVPGRALTGSPQQPTTAHSSSACLPGRGLVHLWWCPVNASVPRPPSPLRPVRPQAGTAQRRCSPATPRSAACYETD